MIHPLYNNKDIQKYNQLITSQQFLSHHGTERDTVIHSLVNRDS
jgi:hypothetical protein